MRGLTKEEVCKNREKYGKNEISKIEKESFIRMLISTLGDPIIKILLIALAVKTVFLFQNFDWYETIGIVIAIFMASLISTMSEYGSEKAFQKLEEDSSKIKSKVIRDGQTKEILIDEIVVGDIVKIETGDQIPADGQIIKGSIKVNEASLNGETKESEKNKKDKIYRSTVVYSGIAIMEVQKVGDGTLYGKIANEIKEKTQISPLKQRLTKLASQISIVGYLGAALVFISYMFSVIVIKNNFNFPMISKTITNFPVLLGHILHALTLSVTIIVVAVPEGLPMMITLVLSSNMKRMLKNNVLVRKLTGIETAGNINILFTDKTGTITKGNLRVITIVDSEGHEYKNEEELKRNYEYYKIVFNSLTLNNESIYDEKRKPIGGNTTDRAILSFFNEKSKEYKLINKIPFSSDKKYSAVQVNEETTLIKGAPEILIDKCNYCYKNNKIRPFTTRIKIKEIINNATKNGIRVLIFARKNNKQLIFEGLIFIKDEVRKEAIIGLKNISNAGIQTIMITGDNKETAKTIGKEVGLIDDKSIIITSEELNKMTDDEVKNNIKNIRVIARALPQDKSRLVRITEENNYVVGMTGDGVNDAPALKKADVGFAMGSGTEVAKEASDIIILDDNLLSISKAILYGRTIFKSIRKFIIFQLTMNICAVSISIIGPFIGIETPVTVVQMLWINMVMDTLAALAFSYEPPLKEYLNEKPKDKSEQIVNNYMKGEILFTGSFSAMMCIFFLKSPLIHSIFRDSKGDKYLLTAFFGLFIFMGIFNSFNARTNRLNLLSHLIENKIFLAVISFILIIQIYLIYYGGDIFRTYGLNIVEFETMLLLSITVVPVDFIRKIYLRKKGKIGGV